MMPQWKDVSGRIASMALSPTGKRVAGRGARRDLHDSRRQGRRAQPDELERLAPSAIRRGRPTASSSRTSATSPASTALYIEAQDGLTPPREIALPNHKHYYTPSWSPDGKKILVPRHRTCKLWVLDVAIGTGEGRRQRSVDGADAHDESGVESRLEVDRVREAPELAVQGDRRRTTSRPARRSR